MIATAQTFYEEFVEADKKRAELVDSRYPDIVSMFCETINMLREVMVSLSKPLPRDLRTVVLLSLINNTTFTSFSLFDLLRKAHYNDVLILLRNTIEGIESMVFIGVYPERTDDWLDNRISSKEMMDLLVLESTRGFRINFGDFRTLYRTASKYVHHSRDSLKSYTKLDFEGPGIFYFLFPVFDQELFLVLAMSALILYILLLLQLGQLFDKYINQSDIKRRAETILDRIMKSFEVFDYDWCEKLRQKKISL